MSSNEFDWQRFQKHNQYTDEELEIFKNDPRRAEAAKKIFSREAAERYLVVEVVSSRGCTAGMKPGHRLVFKGLGILDTARSDAWCAHALGEIPGFASMIQDRFVAGLDPNGIIYNRFSCIDVGVECGGWGQVIMKVYVADETEL